MGSAIIIVGLMMPVPHGHKGQALFTLHLTLLLNPVPGTQ